MSRPDASVAAAATPVTDHRDRAVGLVAAERSGIGWNEPADLCDHRFEHVGRRRSLGYERRYAPQRALLVGEPGELFTALGIRDRGPQELGELGEPMLDLVGEWPVWRGGAHGSPDRAVDDDRGARGGVESGRTSSGGERAGKVRVVIDPGRAARSVHLRDHRRAVEWPARPRLEHMRTIAAG